MNLNNKETIDIANSNFGGQMLKNYQDALKEHKRSLLMNIQMKTRGIFQFPRWHNLKGLLYKNSILLRRDLGFLAFEFLIPVIQISLFCLCIGREPHELHVGIVNNETIYNSTQSPYSLIYVNQLSNYTFQKEFMNWSQAYQASKRGELWAFFDISLNFSQDSLNKYMNPFSGDSNNGSFINLYTDATSK
jgi:hypothetical protein